MFERFIAGINAIGDHIYALLIVIIGGAVAIHGPKEIGELLITTGAAFWRGSGKS